MSAVLTALITIEKSLGSSNDINALRIWGKSNWFNVPSSTIPHHKWKVHITPSDTRNSCSCLEHEIHRIRPCKHTSILALKEALGKSHLPLLLFRFSANDAIHLETHTRSQTPHFMDMTWILQHQVYF